MKNIVFSGIGMGAVYPVWIWNNPNPSPAMAGQEYQRWWGSLFRSFQNFTSLVHSQGPQGPPGCNTLGSALAVDIETETTVLHPKGGPATAVAESQVDSESGGKRYEVVFLLHCYTRIWHSTIHFVCWFSVRAIEAARTLWMKQIGVEWVH